MGESRWYTRATQLSTVLKQNAKTTLVLVIIMFLFGVLICKAVSIASFLSWSHSFTQEMAIRQRISNVSILQLASDFVVHVVAAIITIGIMSALFRLKFL